MVDCTNYLSALKLPRRIQGLQELANNLWWSWHPEARILFKALDRPLWKSTGHNPVKLIKQIAGYRLVAAAEDTEFLKKYDSVMQTFENDMQRPPYPNLAKDRSSGQPTVAYFSMELAIHSSLPLYAGGLGILAGDYCKEASDLGLPMVGIGFMYPQGYFKQRISEDGWQQEIYRQLDFVEAPIAQVTDTQRQPLKVKVELDSRLISLSVWQVNVGRVKLYLLDTHLPENSPADRELSARLYGGNSETRLQQEIILGIGGVRLLRELNISPVIWHANEGHTSFMMLERCREEVEAGLSFAVAQQKIREATVFTTHTPVSAGNDAFPQDLVEKYFSNYRKSLGLERAAFLKLGTQPSENTFFNMTVLGMTLARYCNGVSLLHGAVCRRMWQCLWPGSEEAGIPISSVTNGIHVPTWIAPRMGQLYARYLGADWMAKHDEQPLWDRVADIPDEELWEAHRWLKNKLITELQSRARQRWKLDHGSPILPLTMGALLDSEVLTIGFCRRFTEYKRPWLVFYDINQLKKLINNDLQPVQIIFAGKAHPDDHQGKILIQKVYNLARDPELGGRVVFVEDYDLHLARYLVHGVDVWLNTPRPLQEASGTSGMKASLNGVPHLSVMDGWWHEAYNGANGWAIQNSDNLDPLNQDKSHAQQLFHLLENTIVPLYYSRDRDGIPHDWIRTVKEAIRSTAPSFSARRMLKEYVEQMYLPIALSGGDSEETPVLGPSILGPEFLEKAAASPESSPSPV